MAKELLRNIRPHVNLYRDPKTGIAWVEDGTSGTGHSAHPNIHSTGSVARMRQRGVWGKDERTVKSHGFIYNIDLSFGSGELDRVARDACRCGGNHGGHAGARHEAGRNPRVRKVFPCKVHKGAHPYKVCGKCGKQYCPHDWTGCPRCDPGAKHEAGANPRIAADVVSGERVKVYDNGGKTADRYTVVLMGEQWKERSGLRAMLGMNAHPSHPQGISMFSSGMDGSHLGRRVRFADLPENVQTHARARLAPEKHESGRNPRVSSPMKKRIDRVLGRKGRS